MAGINQIFNTGNTNISRIAQNANNASHNAINSARTAALATLAGSASMASGSSGSVDNFLDTQWNSFGQSVGRNMTVGDDFIGPVQSPLSRSSASGFWGNY